MGIECHYRDLDGRFADTSRNSGMDCAAKREMCLEKLVCEAGCASASSCEQVEDFPLSDHVNCAGGLVCNQKRR